MSLDTRKGVAIPQEFLTTSKVYYAYTPQDIKVSYTADSRKPNVYEESVTPYGQRAAIAVQLNNGVIKYGVCICDEQDPFNKEFGRSLAEIRMNAGFGEVPLINFKQFPEKAEDLILNFLNNLRDSVYRDFGKYERKVNKFNKSQKKGYPAAQVLEINARSGEVTLG